MNEIKPETTKILSLRLALKAATLFLNYAFEFSLFFGFVSLEFYTYDVRDARLINVVFDATSKVFIASNIILLK